MLRWLVGMAFAASVLAAVVVPAVAADLSEEQRRTLDRIVAEHGWNAYGDPVDTVYAAGPRLYDAKKGEPIDRHAYILQHHPELWAEIDAMVPRRETFLAPPADRASPAPADADWR